MNQTLNRSSVNPAIAATRALAKARLGDREALRYLVEQRDAGDVAATRALEQYNKATASALPVANKPFVA